MEFFIATESNMEDIEFYGSSPPTNSLPPRHRAVAALQQQPFINSEDRPSPVSASNPIFINDGQSYFSPSIDLDLLGPISACHSDTTDSPASSVGSCPSKPCSLAKHFFYAEQPEFAVIQANVESTLQHWKDLDSEYYPAEHMWRCKYLQGSDALEVEIHCYWDCTKEDHVIEVRRVKGGSLRTTCKKLLQGLKNRLFASPESSDNESELSVSASHSPVPSKFCSEEQFVSKVELMYKLAKSESYEMRLEASKMLCDLVEKSKTVVPLSQCCVPRILKACTRLAFDSFDDVAEFAVIALSNVAEIPIYQEEIVKLPSLLDYLLTLVLQSCDPVLSYRTAQLHRQAASVLARISSSIMVNKVELTQVLHNAGFTTSEAWNRQIQNIPDERTKSHAAELLCCF